jgi:hypothetical protein
MVRRGARGCVIAACLLRPLTAAGQRDDERADCAQPASDLFFFPGGLLGERTARFDADQFKRVWYSKHLRAMAEPSLSCAEPAGDVYRFLWLRTWGAPIAVRVQRSGEIVTLAGVELDGSAGHPGKVSRRVERRLSRAEWKQVSEAIAKADLWNLPGHLPDGGFDGAQWIVEARSGARYHVVDRHSPKTSSYWELGSTLVRLAGLWPTGKGRDTVY